MQQRSQGVVAVLEVDFLVLGGMVARTSEQRTNFKLLVFFVALLLHLFCLFVGSQTLHVKESRRAHHCWFPDPLRGGV